MSLSNIKPEQVEVGQAQINPNRHIENYLNYYKGLVAPKFAVLVTGEWGVGKTHLITKLLPCESENDEAVYISLFGLKSTDDIYGAVYAATHPWKEKGRGFFRHFDPLIRGISHKDYPVGLAGSIIINLASDWIRKNVDSKKVIIFDDLERSPIETQAILGVINHYVEHHKCRVVVIAHDTKISAELVDTKEKIFGQILRVKPEINDALASFINEIDPHLIRNHVKNHSELVKAIFLKSGVPSLRILRQVVFDIARLFGILKPEHLENLKGVTDVIQLCAAFNFEIRSNYIDLDQIKHLSIDKRNGLENKYGSKF